MKLTIKKFKKLDDGREGIMFTCQIHYKGKQLLSVRDDGNGGGLDIDVYPNTAENHLKDNELMVYISKLPEYDLNAQCRALGYKGISDEPAMCKMDLETLINDMIDKLLNEKEKKRVEGIFNRNSKKSILVGKDKTLFTQYWWKKKSLAEMCTVPRGKEVVQMKVDSLIPLLKEGEKILNADYLKSIGVIVTQ